MKIRARAFFDESGSEELPGYFGVAGFVGFEHQWSVFEKLWKETLQKTIQGEASSPEGHKVTLGVEIAGSIKRRTIKETRLLGSSENARVQSLEQRRPVIRNRLPARRAFDRTAGSAADCVSSA